MDEVMGTHAGGIAEARNPAYQGYQILHWAFVAAPAIAGIDKFTHLLTNWDQYVAPAVARLSPLGTHDFMRVVGVIELLVALVVAVRPGLGSSLVAAWLCGIIVNLVLLGNSLDIALRDFGLLLGALALGRLSVAFERPALR
jgi:hypothetical protein